MNNNLEGAVDITAAPKSQQLRLTLEKLEGGFISDISGKRAIYRDVDDVLDNLNMNRVISRLEHAEYKLNIDIVHIDDHQDFLDLADLRTNYKKEALMSVEEAKECGIIEVEKFNPIKNAPVEPDLSAPIKVTAATAYTIARLKSIDWQAFEDQLPLTAAEKSAICGFAVCSLYSTWPKVLKGTMNFQRPATRIAMTILAQYYEKNLGIRTSVKDKCEKMKDDFRKAIREVELMGEGRSHIKTSDIAKKMIEMRKFLMD